ncbi:hypothetical protein K2Y11_14005 [bacterium]|nr:hypothetical protein [bacterium]
MRRRLWSMVAGVAALFFVLSISLHPFTNTLQADAEKDDPTAWGTDHINQEVPEYTTGGECLFCHRDYVGPRWPKNLHALTMRGSTPEDPAIQAITSQPNGKLLADEVTILLGARDYVRYLKKLPAYGKAATLSGTFHPKVDGGKLDPAGEQHWDDDLFNNKCAGCHATAVDPETAGFGSPGLDCFVCHGIVEAEHAGKPEITFFSPRRKDAPRAEVATCSQCHLRGGIAKSNGRPYPNNFVPEDNLLRDFEVDFSEQNLAQMDVIERHIFANARDVLVGNKIDVTCTSCHSIHGESTKKHTELSETNDCKICHEPGKAMSDVKLPKTRHNKTCQY